MIDLTEKGWCIFGRRGGGKSWLVKHILDSTPNHVVYDPLGEHIGYRQYLPTDRQSVTELEEMVNGLVIPTRVPLFVVEEANKFIRPKPHPLPKGIDDLNDLSRHWGMSVGYVCRRPVQFHTDVVELSHYLFFLSCLAKMTIRIWKIYTRGWVMRSGVCQMTMSLFR